MNFAGPTKYQMNREGGWCDARDLRTQNDEPLRASMRRLRVNYLTSRYKQRGHLADVSRDAAHTLGTTTVSYIDNDATKHIHEEAIERGILSARSVSKIAILADDSIKTASEILDVDAGAAERIISGEQDVFFASCRDFFNRPGGMPNTACDQPWECFICPNAIITRHVLPRVVRFRDFIEQQRLILSASDWQTRFGDVSNVLNRDILPNFTADAINEAERLAKDEVFYIPLQFKG